MTKDSTPKKKKVTFDLPDSESESESKEKPKKRIFQNRKNPPPRPRFEPPPSDLDIKVRPILKNRGTHVYEAPKSSSSLLPLYIINSIINSQLGPSILDSFGEDSESENNADCDTSSNNSSIQDKSNNNLNLSHKTNGESESPDNPEENIDVWFLNTEDNSQKEPVPPPSSKKEDKPRKFPLTSKEKECSKIIWKPRGTILSTRGPFPFLQRSDSSSSDTSESTDSKVVDGDKIKSPKPRRKLRVSIGIHENSTEPETKETYELKLGSTSLVNQDSCEKNSRRVLQPLSASEVSYIDHQCNDSFNSDLSIPKTTVKTSSTELSDVVSYSHPAVLEPEAPLPLKISQNTYLDNPYWETFDIYSALPRRLPEKTSAEYLTAVVCSPPVVLQHSVKNETQPVHVAELTHLAYYCEEYSDIILEPLKTLPKTISTEYSHSVVSLPPVIVRNLEIQKETKVSEINYLDSCCEQYSTLSEAPSQTSATKTSPEYCNAVTSSPPSVLHNQIEELEKSSELKKSSKTRRKSSIQSLETFATEDKENLHQPSHPFDTRTELQANSVLQPITLKSNTLPLSSILSQLTKSTTQSSLTSTFKSTEQPSYLQNKYCTSSYLNRLSKSPLNPSPKNPIFTAVKLRSDLETNLVPSQRILRPYQRKPRQTLSKIMDSSQDLNCAGEPENLSHHKRDDIKEKDILIWIYNMIDEPARVDYEFFLKDGCILCKLMNRIKPGCIPEENITWEGSKSKQKNVTNFLTQVENYGVPKAKLFLPEDLLHLRHIPRVTRCIYALAKIAQEDPNLGPNCPRLGDEPSFVEEAKKVEVPGHRDTKEVLNQIATTIQKQEESAGAAANKLQRMHSLYN